jgi:hypothetical protein
MSMVVTECQGQSQGRIDQMVVAVYQEEKTCVNMNKYYLLYITHYLYTVVRVKVRGCNTSTLNA